MIGGLAALAMLATGQTAMNLNPAPCALTTSEQSWLDGAFRAWDFVRRKRFHLPEAPRPVIIMFDGHCRYEARPGGPLRWTGETFRDRVRLPNGDLIPPNVTAFAAPAGPGAPVFFVMALPPVWSAAHIQSGLGIDGLTQAVFLHEYSHTRQTYFATPYLAALTRRYHLTDDISDDSLQARFEHDANYVRAYERERDLLYATAASPDRAAARALANQALAMMRSRQARFIGAEAYWKPLDDIFLTMKGLASGPHIPGSPTRAGAGSIRRSPFAKCGAATGSGRKPKGSP